MKIVKGGVAAPHGFSAAAVSCGIKKSGKTDVALLFSEKPAVCAGAFTANIMRSGSVTLTEQKIKHGLAQAVIVNSGNANACCGKKEIIGARAITDAVAQALRLDNEKVLICSTGIIGRPLPVEKIKKSIKGLKEGLSDKNGTQFSKAIMTTDTVNKEIAVEANIGGKNIRIGGSAKGSGMICPNMATMLAFFTTDAAIEKSSLKAAFKESVADSFNRITVDGDMSTNDSAIIFANCLAGNRLIKPESPDYFKFLRALKFVSKELAKKIVMDGEGATRFVEILVKGAKNTEDADTIARHIACSSLIKTMIAGGDPNWGRVAASIGSSGVGIAKDNVDIYLGRYLVMKNGAGPHVSKKALAGIFRKKEIKITVDLKSGKASGWIWTCDLTEEYVRINSEYEAGY